MELRRILEPAAARLAAQRATKGQCQAIRACLSDMERAAGGDGDYPLADLAFHSVILSSCNNQFLQQLRNSMSAVLYGSFQFLEGKRGDATVSLAFHRALCVAIEKGEPDAAETAARRLVEQAERDLKDLHGGGTEP
jgi:DNA-binding FadR family transcriptional regulator